VTATARRALLVGVISAVLAACGIQADSAPHDVPEDFRANLSGVSSGTDASGAERIYLVEPGEDQLLRSVPREASSPEELIEILLLGPNTTEQDAEYTTTIPSTLELLSAREQGSYLYLDVTSELTEMSTPGLVQALAQIVYTASELENVESVQITVDGEVIAWPKGNLESTTGLLRTYDYPGLVRTSQPAYPSIPSRA
jgi:hypothetical protein